jgi:hypothetical protein
MKHTCSAIILLSALMTLPGALSARPVNDTKTPTGGTPPDFSGTYVLTISAVPCSLGSRASSFLQIVQSESNLRLRVLATQSIRFLSIERPESVVQNPVQRNGLAQWRGNELFVETLAPAFSLWGALHAVVEGSKLTESLSLTPDGMLLYRTWYRAPGSGVAYGPHEARLTKCRSLD